MGLPWRIRAGLFTVVLISVSWCLRVQPPLANSQESCSAEGRYADISGCSFVLERKEGSCEDLAVAFVNRGRAFSRNGSLRLALADYDNAISLSPKYASAFSGKGEVLLALGQKEQGDTFQAKGSQLEAEAKAEYNRGYEAYWDSKFNAAIEAYSMALAIDPQFAYAHYGRADVYYYRQEWAQAAKDYEAAVRLMSARDPWYESGVKRLKFSRIYAREANQQVEKSEASCSERARLASSGTGDGAPNQVQVPQSDTDVQQGPLNSEPPPSVPVESPNSSPGSLPKPAAPTAPAEPLPQVEQAPEPPTTLQGQVYSTGTGFFVAEEGYLLTNEHVVHGCKAATIMLDDRRVVPATIVTTNSEYDLALLRTMVSAPSVAMFRTSPPLKQGTDIVVFGFPQLGDLSSTGNAVVGNVAATAGPRDDALHIQISAPIQKGNSGGPVLDKGGNVVGVVVWKKQFDTSGQEILQQVNFAINADVARFFLEEQRVNYLSATTERANFYSDTADIAELARKFTVPIECAIEK